MNTMQESKHLVDRGVLDEVVHWVKTLSAVGVSPDKAAEVAKDLLIAASQECGESDWDLDEYDEDDEDED